MAASMGSGNETANHILQNGRITFMWCSFETRPLILRLYCYGERRTLAEWSQATYEKGKLEEYISANAQRVEEKYPLKPPASTTPPAGDR